MGVKENIDALKNYRVPKRSRSKKSFLLFLSRQLLGFENNDVVYHSGPVERALDFHSDVLLLNFLSDVLPDGELVKISSLVLN